MSMTAAVNLPSREPLGERRPGIGLDERHREAEGLPVGRDALRDGVEARVRRRIRASSSIVYGVRRLRRPPACPSTLVQPAFVRACRGSRGVEGDGWAGRRIERPRGRRDRRVRLRRQPAERVCDDRAPVEAREEGLPDGRVAKLEVRDAQVEQHRREGRPGRSERARAVGRRARSAASAGGRPETTSSSPASKALGQRRRHRRSSGTPCRAAAAPRSPAASWRRGRQGVGRRRGGRARRRAIGTAQAHRRGRLEDRVVGVELDDRRTVRSRPAPGRAGRRRATRPGRRSAGAPARSAGWPAGGSRPAAWSGRTGRSARRRRSALPPATTRRRGPCSRDRAGR